MSNHYIISYTDSHVEALEEDFVLLEIMAHNYEDAMIIVANMERYFDGVTIECVEEEKKQTHRKRGNSDKRKLSKHLCYR